MTNILQFRAVHFRTRRGIFKAILFERKDRAPPAMLCLFDDARPRGTLALRRSHRSCLLLRSEPTLAFHPSRAQHLWPPSNRRRLPTFISPRRFHPCTRELIYFPPPDTDDPVYSFAFVRFRESGTIETGDRRKVNFD